MKIDCIFYDGCHLPTRLCTDDCYRYTVEGKHPFAGEHNQADYLRDMEKDRRMMEGE